VSPRYRSLAHAVSVVGALVAALCVAPGAARAQGVGFVGGGAVDPEQVYAGVFVETPPIAEEIRLRPGFDAGRGEGLKIYTVELDVVYRTVVGPSWRFYMGGGPVVAVIRVDEGYDGVKPSRLVEDTTGGFEGLLGFEYKNGLLFEFKVGHANGTSRMKFGAGFKFGKK
jgi:hypothetical protein